MKYEGLFLAQNQYSKSISYFITILLINEEQMITIHIKKTDYRYKPIF